MPPLELRARRRRGLRGDAVDAPGAIDLVLPHRGPFDADGLFAWMGARAVGGVESATATSFARTLRLAGGPAWFELRARRGRARAPARAPHASRRPVDARHARAAPVRPGCRPDRRRRGAGAASRTRAARRARSPASAFPGAADPHEMLIRAMVGQQITVAAARTALTALADALGEPVGRSAPTGSRAPRCSRRWRRSPSAGTRCCAVRPPAPARSSARPRRSPTARCTLGPGDDGGRPARRAARDARHRALDRRLRAHARARRPRRLPAGRRRGAHRCGRGRASRRAARARPPGPPAPRRGAAT